MQRRDNSTTRPRRRLRRSRAHRRFPRPTRRRHRFLAPQVFAGAGDIARCNEGDAAGVSRLLDTIGGTIFTLGDNAYMNGTAARVPRLLRADMGTSQEPHASLTRQPRIRDAPARFPTSSTSAPTPASWAGVLQLRPGRVAHHLAQQRDSDVAQLSARRLARSRPRGEPAKCTLAYWHKPLFSSGPNGDHPHMRPFWTMLYDAGADVILTGHDHLYERFGPQDPDGRPDSRSRHPTVHRRHGRRPAVRVPAAVKPNSEKRIRQHGILKLTLMSDSYTWEFLPVANSALDRDQGADVCH